MRKQNLFISFEGIDGSGKSTQIIKLEKFLKSKDKKVKIFREPGGNRISESIRDILLDNDNKNMSSETELLLYLASRSQLINENISKAIDDGYYVICDRFIDSTLAYQGYGRGFDNKMIQSLKPQPCQKFNHSK